MPKTRDADQALPIRVRAMLTLSPQQAALIDEVRGAIPFSTWCRDACVRVATAAKAAKEPR